MSTTRDDLRNRIRHTGAVMAYDKKGRHALLVPLKEGHRFSGYMSIPELLRWFDGYEQGRRDWQPTMRELVEQWNKEGQP